MTDRKGASAPNIQHIVGRHRRLAVTDDEAIMLRMYSHLSERDKRVVKALLSQLIRENNAFVPIVGSERESGDG